MLIILPGGELRDKQSAHMAFKFMKSTFMELEKEIFISTDENFLPGMVRPKFSNGIGEIPGAQSFTIESIESSLCTEYPEKFIDTELRLRIGEKDYYHAPVLGEVIKKDETWYFRHFEFQHTADGICYCPRINPLQSFHLSLDCAPREPFILQYVLTGYVYNPVP